ncbi:hypothetical protein EDD96_5839 [Streptomyces sp. Ag109_G2-6]|uniref:hypothetical protein n=1 Tax=Streptomyces TaxID=1883 RepID=UPI0009A4D54B|nr:MULTISPECIES: hypothetical protein [Streptomyces]RPF29319.1 hypothetical protein EDD96_5839 [Streptomyces sp. Ag109_G2-6]
MTVRDIRTAAKIIGRRNALRYLAVGAGSALLAACTGKEKPAAQSPAPSSSPPGTPSAPASPSAPAPVSPSPSVSASPAATGVAGRAFAAFVTGTWAIRSTLPGTDGGRKSDGRATIGADGTWTIVWTGDTKATWNGRWSHQAGRLEIQVVAGPKGDGEGTDVSFAQPVPDGMDGPGSAMLPWYPLGANDRTGQLEAAYNGKELRIRHLPRNGTMSIHVCSRV